MKKQTHLHRGWPEGTYSANFKIVRSMAAPNKCKTKTLLKQTSQYNIEMNYSFTSRGGCDLRLALCRTCGFKEFQLVSFNISDNSTRVLNCQFDFH